MSWALARQAWLAKMRFVEVGKSWCVRVRFVLARQVGYVSFRLVKSRSGLAGEVR